MDGELYQFAIAGSGFELCEAVRAARVFKCAIRVPRVKTRVVRKAYVPLPIEDITEIRLTEGNPPIDQTIGYRVKNTDGKTFSYRWFVCGGFRPGRMVLGEVVPCNRKAKGAFRCLVLQPMNMGSPIFLLKFDKNKKWYLRRTIQKGK